MLRLMATLMALALSSGAASAEALALKRGVNVHEWLNWSPLAADGSYRWPPYQSEDEWLGTYRPMSDWPPGDQFERIRGMGFDFVRLTVDPGPLLDSEGPRRAEALAVVEAAVRRVTGAGLKVVFNLHGNSQVPRYGMDLVNAGASSAGIARYIETSAEVAAMLASVGTDKVAFEPFNEPAYYPCDASGSEDWQQIMAGTVAAVRAASTELTVVATGACGGSVTGLTDIDPGFDDENMLYSFHMYEPHLFTHQRADRQGDFASGLPWPAARGSFEAVVATLRAQMEAAGLDEGAQAQQLSNVGGYIEQYFDEGWGEAQVTARIGEAVDWATAHGIPTGRLFMGEFGVILMTQDGRSGAFDADRLRYIAAVREAAEAHGIPWAIWEYANPFGMSVILKDGPAEPDLKLLGALGLAQ